MRHVIRLDARWLRSIRWAVAGYAVLLVVFIGVGIPTLTWVWLALLVMTGSAAHPTIERAGGPYGRFQAVLGIGRTEAVRARYAGVALTAAAGLVVVALAGCYWASLGLGTSGAVLSAAVVAAAFLTASVQLTVGYVLPQQQAAQVLIGVIVALAMLPAIPALASGDWSTESLARTLTGGPVPVGVVLAGAASAVWWFGRRAAIRSYARADR